MIESLGCDAPLDLRGNDLFSNPGHGMEKI